MKFDLKNVSSHFCVYGDYISGQPYGTGHINDTFAVTYCQAGSQVRYILQRINHFVFKNPILLMNNITRVVEHIRRKLSCKEVEDITRRVLTLVDTIDGKKYHKDDDGNVWRMYFFVEGACTYDVLNSIDQARLAAQAFGQFQCQLADMPSPSLGETIPDFHKGTKRYQAFLDALNADVCNRAASAKAEIDFLNANADIFQVFPKLIETRQIPIRITHNDTKINNIMFDNLTSEAICVIDLDTVMPGLALYDFGDIVRTTVSTGAEDEVDLSKVYVQKKRFEAILEGYLMGAGCFLNHVEIDHLLHSGKMITLMIGTRFLTDYLCGDIYFKVHRNGHNLDRCRTQFKLVKSLIEQEDALNLSVKNCYNRIMESCVY